MAALRLLGIRTLLLGPIDLDIGAGETLFVSGASGSGKSLLLRAVADLDPNQGEVLIGERRRSALSPAQWRRRVGLLPAESGWWAEQVGEHFEQAPSASTQADSRMRINAPDADAAQRPGEDPRRDKPGLTALLGDLGFEPNVLDWSVGRLSTGERQRLALARMLHIGPDALLLDEPTANLDPDNRDRVEEVIEGYQRERDAAVLWVSHDPDQRRRVGGRSLVIRDRGLIREEQA
ncbi:MAG: ATP-binding cassette domain-containing protein [Thiohalocapsa sp.]|nr:ATP-binding cassette domain-containing protein [Thiohalocapsa sp.]MCF7991773.1 ATP-binding cassette domain-containing protein [Thiohalocapsa sp.]